MDINVTPAEFQLVNYKAADIREVAQTVAEAIGLPHSMTIDIEIDQTTPLGGLQRRELTSEKLSVVIESGAFEDRKAPRQLSGESTWRSLAKVFFRAADILSAEFGYDGPADDADLPVRLSIAWDTYSLGRFERLGFSVSKPSRIYAFRNQFGFTDEADEKFNQLWSGVNLSWADLKQVTEIVEV